MATKLSRLQRRGGLGETRLSAGWSDDTAITNVFPVCMSEDFHLCNDTFCVVTIPPLRGESFFFPPQKTRSDLEVTIYIFFENSVRTPGEGLFQVEMVQGWDLVVVFFFRPMREDRIAATSFGWVSSLTEAFALHV